LLRRETGVGEDAQDSFAETQTLSGGEPMGEAQRDDLGMVSYLVADSFNEGGELFPP